MTTSRPAEAPPAATRDRRSADGDGRLHLVRVPFDPDAWEAIAAGYPDMQVFHSSAWMRYLVATQGVSPVVAEVRSGTAVVGHFLGATTRRMGVTILGSPLRGWGTAYMGFLLQDGVDRRLVAAQLAPFAFSTLGCLHVELGDAGLGPHDLPSAGYTMDAGATFVVDLSDSEAEILGRMRSTTRNYVRQGARKGLTVDIVEGSDALAFADEYHEQLIEVFGRQGLTPTYPVERVQTLIDVVHPSGQLLLLRVRAPDGRSIATGLVVGRNRSAVLWGAAFRRADADLHPNELMHWEAMRHWRSRGVTSYDMGGRGDYKAKYGGTLVQTARFRRSKYPVLDLGRDAVRSAFRARQVIRALPRRWANRRTAATTGTVDR